MMTTTMSSKHRWKRVRAIAEALRIGAAILLAATASPVVADDAVEVTAALDDPVLVVGQSTVLRVFGRIDPALDADAERIFSWYVDALATGSLALVPNWATLAMPTSDNVPQTSGPGDSDGRRRRGIHNTFLDRPGAGHGAPVELFSVSVTAMALGETVFSIVAGTSVENLAEDFIVAASDSGAPFTGGTYIGAAAVGRVVPLDEFLDARLVPAGGREEVRFNPVPGRTHRVEVSVTLEPDSWIPLPGAPHDLGSVVDPDSDAGPRRFYRILVEGEDP